MSDISKVKDTNPDHGGNMIDSQRRGRGDAHGNRSQPNVSKGIVGGDALSNPLARPQENGLSLFSGQSAFTAAFQNSLNAVDESEGCYTDDLIRETEQLPKERESAESSNQKGKGVSVSSLFGPGA